MAKRTCTIDECERKVEARGWCHRHYENWRRRGNPTPRPTIEQRVFAYVDVGHPLGCWVWTGTVSTHGYGRTSVGGRDLGAHRVIYELLVGPILDGLELDHLCRNPPCVNPDHLEPVTHAENVRRAARWNHDPSMVCLHGHDRTGDGSLPDGRCRTCTRLSNRRSVQRQRDRMEPPSG